MESETYLAHYGVLGMKWGVRKDQSSGSGRPKKKKLSKKEAARIKKAKIRKMSDKELEHRVRRLELEKKYSNLTKEEVSEGRRFVNKFIMDNGSKMLSGAVTIVGAEVARRVLRKAGVKGPNTQKFRSGVSNASHRAYNAFRGSRRAATSVVSRR